MCHSKLTIFSLFSKMYMEKILNVKKDVVSAVKTAKPFKKGDLIIYSSIVLLVLILFSVFVFFPKETRANGFKVYCNNDVVFTHEYGTDFFDVKADWSNNVSITKDEHGFQITVLIHQDSHAKNVIYCDEENLTVKMIDSNCSVSKDCTFMPAISCDGAIYCLPHGLKISPLGSAESVPPITGA